MSDTDTDGPMSRFAADVGDQILKAFDLHLGLRDEDLADCLALRFGRRRGADANRAAQHFNVRPGQPDATVGEFINRTRKVAVGIARDAIAEFIIDRIGTKRVTRQKIAHTVEH